MLLSLRPSFPLPPHVLKSSLYVYLFIPALKLGTRFISTFFFFRFHIYALAYGICFSLSDLLHSVWQTLGPSTSLQITEFRFWKLFLLHASCYVKGGQLYHPTPCVLERNSVFLKAVSRFSQQLGHMPRGTVQSHHWLRTSLCSAFFPGTWTLSRCGSSKHPLLNTDK